ncbi:MAG: hypothetical protein DA443_04990 [Bacteroidetes bacterium]|nr:MAG: hypothetical protein DA443_04990 [Bacteroidota bacterium]
MGAPVITYSPDGEMSMAVPNWLPANGPYSVATTVWADTFDTLGSATTRNANASANTESDEAIGETFAKTNDENERKRFVEFIASRFRKKE